MPMPPCPPRSKTRGVTLIELMIAVVVVGILAAIAFPSFMDSIRKGRRSDALGALAAVQQAQERWRTNNSAYASNLSASAPTGLGLPSTTSSGYYTLSLANVTATGYQAVATAVSGKSQASDGDCAKLGVEMNGGMVRYGSASLSGTVSFANTNPCWAR